MMELKGFRSNFQGFCKAAKISREGLRACLKDGGTLGLSGHYQKALAAFAGFKVDWPEWIETDPVRRRSGQRRDTAEKFLDRCARELSSQPNDERRSTAAQANATPGSRLKAVRTAEPEACYEPIATLELSASQPGPGEPWPLSADLVCLPARMDRVLVAVKRGWLTFHCGEGEAERLDKRKGYPGGLAIGSATCIPVTAYTKRPSWEIYSASGPLGSLSLPYDFCLISGLVPGCTITVTFSVYIKDHR